jgi:hypothetical protein
MQITAPKLIAGFITALWGFASLLGAPSALSEQPEPAPVARDYLIEPTSTTSEPMMTIDPYATPAAQFAQLAINLGWPVSEYSQLIKIIERESHGNPSAHNTTDPMTGSYGLMQINGFWCQNANSFLQTNGILTNCAMLLDPRVNLRAGLVIWNRSGWNPWSTK